MKAYRRVVSGIDMAKRIYNKNNIDKQERHLGKTAILGCSYGMGHKKFRETCMNQGLDITEETAQKAVSTYRQTYNKVQNLWNIQQRSRICESVYTNHIPICIL